ncbi:MAG: phosphoglycerate kinase [Alphaproteobacteria bacterium CG11_big_fil_rev_8_21_14_0_20_39_49]|nr:MAG: phosphoglycerate kinase [Alphaproteobacteria bacterium CG11_big_fil_rev_8_21_14_0_20_39_49]
MKLKILKDLNVNNKVVLCRVDFNVPMKNGRVEDNTRILRIVPTIKYLIQHNAKVVIISHFGRPKGEFDRELSLVPLADALSNALDGKFVKFAVDCIGRHAKEAVESMESGDVLLLENLRFHKGEKDNDTKFAEELASLGDVFVNDTFSCSHRSHASIVGITKKLPSAAGLLLQSEIENLESVFKDSEHPMAAIVGGSKVSTKLDLLNSLIKKVDLLVIGGAMANTFLKAKGYNIGKSLHEKELLEETKNIIEKAKVNNCEIYLPQDAVVAKELRNTPDCKVVSIDEIPSDEMILDLGPRTIAKLTEKLEKCKMVVWNGPLGAFEYRPFDVASITLAQNLAYLTSKGVIKSVAGGGDVVAALGLSGLNDSFTYISTGGGAFLEWLEGKGLPGINVLYEGNKKNNVA